MCIRDSRDDGHRQEQVKLPEHRTFQQAKVHQIGLNRAFRACLLYTSDAADERSSVDLGGRRIIKKKTTIKHRAYGRSVTNIQIYKDK